MGYYTLVHSMPVDKQHMRILNEELAWPIRREFLKVRGIMGKHWSPENGLVISIILDMSYLMRRQKMISLK